MALRAVELDEWLKSNEAAIGAYVTKLDSSSVTNLVAVAHRLSVARLWRSALDGIGRQPAPVTTISDETRRSVADLLGALPLDKSPSKLAFQCLDQHWPNGFEGGASTEGVPLPRIRARSGSLLESLDAARHWVRLRRSIDRCCAKGLSQFLESLGSVSGAEAPGAFEKRFYRLWVSSAIEQHPSLANFNQAKGSDLLEKYRSLDERVRKLAIARAQSVARTGVHKVTRECSRRRAGYDADQRWIWTR